MVRILYSGREDVFPAAEVERCFAWTSQTKPGPVIAFAVVNIVLQRVSMLPKDLIRASLRRG